MKSASSPARQLGLILLAIPLFFAAQGALWTELDDRAAWRTVWFEPGDGGSQLVAQAPEREAMVPRVHVDRGGVLQVPEGRAVSVSAELDLQVEAPGGGLPVVVLAQGDGVLTNLVGPWGPFDPDRPWREQAADVDALEARCGTGPVEVRGGQARLGECTWGPGDQVLLLGADRWASVQRAEGPFPTRRGVREGALVPAGVLALLATGLLGLGLGVPATLSTAVTCLLLAALAPHLGPVATAIAGGVGGLAAAVRALRWLGRRAMPSALVVVAGVALAGDLGPSDGVLLVGYSTVEGDGLRPGTTDPASILQTTCPDVGGVDRLARAGGTIAWLGGALCSQESAGTTLMLGGTNDDLIYGLQEGSWTGRLALLNAGLKATLAPAEWRPADVDAFYAGGAERALEQGEEQAAQFARAVGCSPRFLLLQNFTIDDVRPGRGPVRDELVAARRAAVDGAGGRSVDLLEALGDDVALSWYSDYIHLSAVGHQRVAQLACEELTR